MTPLENENVSDVYTTFRAIPAETWARADVVELAGRLKKAGLTTDPMSLGIATRVLGRLAHQLSEEEFLDAVVEGEIPPVKLTTAEMELLRGGDLWGWCVDKYNEIKAAYEALKDMATPG